MSEPPKATPAKQLRGPRVRVSITDWGRFARESVAAMNVAIREDREELARIRASAEAK